MQRKSTIRPRRLGMARAIYLGLVLMSFDIAEFSNVTDKVLKKFSYIFTGCFLFFFFIILPKVFGFQPKAFYLLLPVALLVAAFARPKVIKPFFVLWMCVGSTLGAINSRVILSVFFILVLAPYSLVLRCFGRGTLRKSYEPQIKSYRVDSSEANSSNDYTLTY